MSEALACGGEDVGGLLHLVLLVAWRLGIFNQRALLLLTDFIKLLLGFFELSQVTGKQKMLNHQLFLKIGINPTFCLFKGFASVKFFRNIIL